MFENVFNYYLGLVLRSTARLNVIEIKDKVAIARHVGKYSNIELISKYYDSHYRTIQIYDDSSIHLTDNKLGIIMVLAK